MGLAGEVWIKERGGIMKWDFERGEEVEVVVEEEWGRRRGHNLMLFSDLGLYF